MAECVFSLLTKDSIRRLCASITIIFDNFNYTFYNHTDFGRKKFLRNLGKFVEYIGNILRNASKKFRKQFVSSPNYNSVQGTAHKINSGPSIYHMPGCNIAI